MELICGFAICRVVAMGVIGFFIGGAANIPRFLFGGRYLDYQGHIMFSQITFLPCMVAAYFICTAAISEIFVFPFRLKKLFFVIPVLMFVGWGIWFTLLFFHPAQGSRYLRLCIITLSGVGFASSFAVIAKEVVKGKSKLGAEMMGGGLAIFLFSVSAYIGGLIFGYDWFEFDFGREYCLQWLSIGTVILATSAGMSWARFLRKLDG
jgi:hypothetical protein